ncbi:uncharacterized protein LOC143738896 [Siphateles boraxobius]|uniref:uncharacterized protein LOC143738896 n=1 Tax=Siphateles boraxobius TaxID=180520 RepID=UPI0040630282
MSCESFVNNVTGETISVHVKEPENMIGGEITLDGADQSENDRPFSKTRKLEDHQTLEDCDIKYDSSRLMVGGVRESHTGPGSPVDEGGLIRSRSNEQGRPTMQQERKHRSQSLKKTCGTGKGPQCSGRNTVNNVA